MNKIVTKSLRGLFFIAITVLSLPVLSQPQIQILGFDNNVISSGSGTPDALDGTDFGKIPLVTTGSRQFVIENTGNSTLNLTSVVTDNGLFVPSGFTSGAIPPSETRSFFVDFDPVANGPESATVTIASDAAADPAFTFAIAAEGSSHFETLQPGNWSDLATWGAVTSLPASTDDVVIAHDVVLDMAASVANFDLSALTQFDFSNQGLTVNGYLQIDGTLASSPGAVLSLTALGDQDIDFGCQDVQRVVFGGSGIKNMIGSGFDVQELLWIKDNAILHANGIRIGLEANADWLEQDNGYFDPGYDYHTTYLRGASHDITMNSSSYFGQVQVSANVTFNSAVTVAQLIGQNDVVLNLGPNTVYVKENWQMDGANSFLLNYDPGASIEFPYPGSLYFGAFGSEYYPTVRITGGGNASFYGPVYFNEDLTIDNGQVNASGINIYFTGASGITVSAGASLNISGSSGLTFDTGQISNDGSVLFEGWNWESFVSLAGNGFTVQSAGESADIGAVYTSFSGLGGNGVSILGGNINGTYNFSNTRFNGGSGNALLTFGDVEVASPINDAEFYSGSTYNVQKLAGNQIVTFYNAQGDFAGEAYDNDFSGSIEWTYPQNAISFTGTEYVTGTGVSLPQGNSARTVEAWVRPSGVNDDIFNYGTPVLRFGIDNDRIFWGEAYTEPIITAGVWQHVAASYDGSAVTFYLNGVLVETVAVSALSTSANDYMIGRFDDSYFNGEIDELRIWNTARTQAQIAQAMFQKVNPFPPSLVAYFGFDQTSGAPTESISQTTASQYNDPAYVASEAFAPILMRPTNVGDDFFTLNWVPVYHASFVSYELDDDSDFSSLLSAGYTSTPYAGSENIYVNLSGYFNAKLYLRIYFDDGQSSPYSNTIEFMVTPGNTLHFDGVDDYVSAPALDFNGNSFTIEAWVKRDNMTGTQMIFSMGPQLPNVGLHIGFTNDDFFFNFWANDLYIANVATKEATWQHWAMSYDAGTNTRIVFRDGINVGSDAPAEDYLYTGSLDIGRYNDDSFYFDGSIDEVKIWSYAKTDFSDRFFSLKGNETGLLAYYNFDESNGLSLSNASAPGQVASLVNMTGAEWEPSGAMIPTQYQVTGATEYGFTVNWEPTNAADVYVEAASDPTFASPVISSVVIGNGVTATAPVSASLTPNNPFYARVYVNDGVNQSPYSNVVEFMPMPGNALSFSGNASGERVVVPPSESHNLDVGTWEAWVKMSVLETSRIIYKEDGVGNARYELFYTTGDDRFEAEATIGTVVYQAVTTTPILADVWYHVAAVYNGSDLRLYLNGVLEGMTPVSGAIDDNPGSLGIGGDPAGSISANAVIDEVRIWNIPLSAIDIQTWLYTTLAGNEYGLVAYYRFDEGIEGLDNTSVTSLPDLSVNGNNGTLTGFATLDGTNPANAGWGWIGSAAMQSGLIPAAPTEFIVYRISEEDVRFEWTDNAFDETSYRIEVATDYDFSDGSEYLAVGPNITTSALGIGPDVGYFFRVAATNASGQSYSSVEFGTTEAFPGKALQFAGVSEEVIVPNDPAIQTGGDFTWEAWFYTDGTPQLGQIMQKRNPAPDFDQVSITISDGNIGTPGAGLRLVAVVIDDSGATRALVTGADISAGWHHVALTNAYFGTTTLYLDAVPVATSSTSFSGSLAVPFDLHIGSSNEPLQFFTGLIDEVRVWEGFVKTDFSDRFQYLQGDEPLLVAYYPFDEGTGTKTVDRSIQINDADITGAIWQTSGAGVPNTPTQLRAKYTNGEVQLAWGFDSSVEENLVVERYHQGPQYELIATLPAGATVYTDTDVMDGQQYEYRVAAKAGPILSGYSNVTIVDVTGSGNTLDFDGVSDYFAVNDDASLDITTNLTIEGWVYLNILPTDDIEGIVSKWDSDLNERSFGLGVSPQGNVALAISSDGTSSFSVLSQQKLQAQRWYHIAATFSAGTAVQIFIDGVLDKEVISSVPASIFSGSALLNIGAFGASPDYTTIIGGSIDELRIWSIVLSDTEIRDNIHSKLNGDEFGLVSYYNFDEIEGNNLWDQTGTNHGTGVSIDGTEWTYSGAFAPFVHAATGIGTASFTGNWTEVPGADGYRITYSTSPTFYSESLQFATVNNQGSSGVVNFSLTPLTKYYYRVSFIKGDYVSPPSSGRSFMTTPGYALQFDGVDDEVTYGGPVYNSLSDFTIEFWCKIPSDNVSGNGVFFEQNDPAGGGTPQIIQAALNNNQPYFFMRDANGGAASFIQGTTAINDDSWHHIGYVRQGSELWIYLDGVLESYSDAAFTGAINFPSTSIGRIKLYGELDELRVWNEARGAAYFETAVSSLSTAGETTLALYHRFDEPTGTAVPDLSRFSHTGSLVGGTSWVPSNAFTESVAAGDGIIYVNAAAAGLENGTSWANAFRYLRDALNVAQAGNQIWIAQGTYKPTGSKSLLPDLPIREFSFDIDVNDISIFGGFDGTETDLWQRYADPALTILTGDLAGNDGPDFVNYSDNSENVVTINAVSGIYIDGLTITGGNATGNGGGITAIGAEFTLNEVFVEKNKASTLGGGIYAMNSAPIFLRSHIQYNDATSGGGVYLDTSEPFFYRTVFQYNTGVAGAGLYMYGSNQLDNFVGYYTKFLYNNDAVTGGGLFLDNSFYVAFNNLFVGNYAYDNGGAVYATSFSSFKSVNSTFADNASNDGTGGLAFTPDDAVEIYNSIFWGNTSVAVSGTLQSINDGGPFTIENTLVESWDPLAYGDEVAFNVLTGDPLLSASYGPQAGSPAIDAGDDTILQSPEFYDILDENNDEVTFEPAPYDLAENSRYVGTSVDLGPFEYFETAPPAVIYVKWDAAGANDGTSWTNALTDLQDALMLAQAGDEIWVAAGSYYASGDDASVSFVLPSGVSVYGGFNGTETDLIQRDPVTNTTVLDGELSVSLNSYLVVLIDGQDNDARLDGFTVTSGNGEFGLDNYGGGIKVTNGATPTLANLTIAGNSNDYGAGLYVNGSHVFITDCLFDSNSCINFGTGGAIYSDASTVDISRSTFFNNSGWEAGAIYLTNGSGLTAVNVDFEANSAFGTEGGGIKSENSSITITNGRFYNNYAGNGGGIYFSTSTAKYGLTLYNTTMASNSNGGAIGMSSSNGFNADAYIYNSIIWGNSSSQIVLADDGSGVTVSHSVVQDWDITDYSGFSGIFSETNVSTGDPLFTNMGSGDLSLMEGSAAQEWGDLASLPQDVFDIDNDDDVLEALPIDLAGNPRVSGGLPDAGAYELQAASSPFIVSSANSQITPSPLAPETYNVVVAGIKVDVTQNTHLTTVTFTTNTDLYEGLENYRLYFSADEAFDYPGDIELSASPFASMTEISFFSMAFELGIGGHFLYLVADVANNANPTTPAIMFSMNQTGIAFGSGTVAPFTYSSTETSFTSDPVYTVSIANQVGSEVTVGPGETDVVLLELHIEATPYGEMSAVTYGFSEDPAGNLENYRLVVSVDDNILTTGDNDSYSYWSLDASQVSFTGIAGGFSSPGKYFFLIADVPASPPGTISPITFTVNTESFGVNFGTVAVTSISSDPLTVVPLGVNLPIVDTNTGITVDEGANHIITTSELSGSDADLPPASSLVFTISSGPVFGQVLISGLPVSSFSQQDLISGLVSYQHDGSENFADSFNFTLSDGTYTTTINTFNITVNSVNDLPTLTAFAGAVATTSQNLEVEITLAQLLAQANEADVDGAVTGFRVTTVTSGTLRIGANAGTATAYAPATNDVVDGSNSAFWTPAFNASGSGIGAFEVLAIDNQGGASLTAGVVVPVNVTAANSLPTLTAFAAAVATTLEDTEVQITLGQLLAQGNEADADGTVTGFRVTAVTSGSLRVGASAATATAFAVSTNDLINGTNNAYWTPALNANGLSIGAFQVLAVDNQGGQSVTAGVVAPVNVTSVNDPPTLTAFAGAVATTAEDTEVSISLAQLLAQGNEADVDGTVTGFRVTAVTSGSLRIGTSAGTATAYAPTTNDQVNGTSNAYWTPALNVNGLGIAAMEVVAIDNEGGVSATAGVLARVDVTAVNDVPVLADQLFTTAENNAAFEAQLVFSDPDGDAVTLSIVSGNTAGTFALNSTTGLITVANVGGLDYDRTPQFLLTVSITDGTATVQATVTIQLTDLDDPLVGPQALAATDVTTSGMKAIWRSVPGATSYLLEIAADELFANLVPGYGPATLPDTTSTVTGLYHATRYYYRARAVTAGGTTENSNVISARTLVSSELTADSTALVRVFDQMGGAGWTNRTGWKSAQVRGWYGIVVENSRVVAVNLPNNNLTGTFPALSDTELSSLRQLDLSGNQITAVSTSANLSQLQMLNLSDNRLDFSSLEPFTGVASYTYAPQAAVLNAVDVLQERGDPLTMDRTVGGTANSYQWFKNGTAISGATGATFQIAFPTFVEEGDYTVQVTSALVPNLVLTSRAITLRVSSLERDRLVLTELFNLTKGENWVNKTGWGSTDLSTWFGITVTGQRVTGINLPQNNLIGELPARLGDMRRLTSINLSNNEITSLPAMTNVIALSTFNVANNRLEFDDLEPNIGIAAMVYSPQKTVGQAKRELKPVNTSFTVETPVGGSANIYQWQRNGVVVAGATQASYGIQSLRYETMGSYRVQVTNSLVPNLVLQSEPLEVLATATVSGSIVDINNVPVPAAIGALLGVRSGAYDTTGVYQSGPNGQYEINNVILGDYLLFAKQDLTKFIPSYYRSTIDWAFADLIQLRDNTSSLTVNLQNKPAPLTPADGDNTFGGTFESDLGNAGGRVLDRSRVSGAGVSVSRQRFRSKGNEDEVYELVAYVQTDENGDFEITNLPDGDYRLNIQYPGIPMDPTSFIQFQLGGGSGVGQNSIRISALATPSGIVVTKVKETGIYLDYFKDLVVYPNPADRFINISYQKLVKGIVVAELLDLSGQKVASMALAQGVNREHQIDIEHLRNGIYILRFTDLAGGGREIVSIRVAVLR